MPRSPTSPHPALTRPHGPGYFVMAPEMVSGLRGVAMARLVRRVLMGSQMDLPIERSGVPLTIDLGPLARGEAREVRLGRDPTNDVCLDDAQHPLMTSRFHASLHWRDGGFVVQDVSSVNGTYVDGSRLRRGSERALERGCTVSFAGPAYIAKNGLIVRNPFCYRLDTGGASPPPYPDEDPPSPPSTKRKRDEFEADNYEVDPALSCGVCMDLYLRPIALRCGHAFCCDCITRWLYRPGSSPAQCPACRSDTGCLVPSPCRPLCELSERAEAALPSHVQRRRSRRVVQWEGWRAHMERWRVQDMSLPRELRAPVIPRTGQPNRQAAQSDGDDEDDAGDEGIYAMVP